MRRLGAALLAFVSVAFCGRNAWAGEKVIYSFASANGAGPRSVLVRDALGNSYGTTYSGGAYDFGTVFELSLASAGRGWKETLLYSFTGLGDGSSPSAGLIFDAAGSLYGTTLFGGTYGCGVVFELTSTISGWSESVLYSFTGGNDGCFPQAGLIQDAAGNLYGTTSAGGYSHNCAGLSEFSGCGAVFELSPGLSGWKETTLHSFTGGRDGGQPIAGLILDSSGNLYGTAFDAGTYGCTDGCGTVFRLSPTGGGGWVGTVLLSFGNATGAYPAAPLVLDAAGNLYGTASARGITNSACTNGCGAVFKLSPSSGDRWEATNLHVFTGGSDGGEPFAGLVFDSAGNLYGTTKGGGSSSGGVVFKLTPTSGGWRELVLHAFEGSTDGAGPLAGVVLDDLGAIYGTTSSGGTGTPSASGTVYEVIP